MSVRMLVSIVVACSACGGAGSSSSDSVSGDCAAYVVPAGTDLTQPIVSFANDVMPVFGANCSASSCHGTTQSPTGGLFLGSEAEHGGDATMVRAGLVGVAAMELPTMSLVTAGDATHSYLMHKLDGDQCQYQAQCSGGDCMAFMPSGSAQPLPEPTRDVLRRWIAQGAILN